MNFSTWISIYMPLFVVFFIILPHQNKIRKYILFKIKRRKGLITMSNDVIKKYIGKKCKITTGSLGTTVVGKIVEVKENWIEVETRKGNELINADFVQSIKIK
ncbi:hypothetical protein BET03_07165 [Thermohalobacter berrensis]|uniref:Preprotein translocase subunit YajC n=2 Tax=Thermohalobacter berrensis TaxID=99594 RepID=A0A419SUC1_9FIRM|nr:hypothetical protein BET03_07165 [Thermohalobacter berrensis]